ncbi:sporulation protein YqfD [Anaerofustis stercorihominis]|uniref:Sporulation protein YqfD n=1 Tax=Anaerofustis stercorihominis DSM 17244 TaxID=445971 RepID=B1C5M2_9FIRM|nr:sporulation protein YqfD [Anaerofustis stercorihominis]EDS73654.1 putative sporulation protein YqfD [Anaerofustis stercorihominis DSM 17244]MCQ4795559.1 sporulation protein YqfD [Anaerofustis stercorihominis]
MLILKFYHYIMGYYLVEIKGLHPEKYINLINHNNISIWDIKKLDKTTIVFKIMLTDFEKAEQIAKRAQYIIDIKNEYGKKSIFKSLKKRRVFIFSAFLISVIIFAFSFFIWDIQITGTDRIDRNDILSTLEDAGFKEGCYKYGVDKKEISKVLLNTYHDLSDVTIDYKGTQAKIKLVEKNTPIKKFNKSKAVDLVAGKGGKIESIIAYNGIKKVKKGDKVKKGSLLISGKIKYEGKEGDIKHYYIHAMGDVFINTTYTYKDIIINPYVIKENDEFIKETAYSFKNRTINYKKTVANKSYIGVKEEKKKVKILFIPIPIEQSTTKWYNINNLTKKDENQIKKEVIEVLNKTQNIDKDNIVDIYLSIDTLDNNYYSITAKVKLKENIVEERQINKR